MNTKRSMPKAKFAVFALVLLCQLNGYGAERPLRAPISGPWGGIASIDAQQTPVQLDVQIRADSFLFYGQLRDAAKTLCVFQSVNTTIRVSKHFSVACENASVTGEAQPEFLAFDLSNGEHPTIAWGTGSGIAKVTLSRLIQNPRTRLEGDWVSDWPAPKACVLHIYQNNLPPDGIPQQFQKDFDPEHIVAFLDEPYSGLFGVSVGLLYADNKPEFGFSLQGVGTEFFQGKIYPERQEILGHWSGHPNCSTFSRLPSFQKPGSR